MERVSSNPRPMTMGSECYTCLERLVDLAVDLSTSDANLRQRTRQAARQILDQMHGPGAIPATIANQILPVIHHISGNTDPFAARKTVATTLAARMHERLAPAYGDDLEALLLLAAKGNALDFFRGQEEVTWEMQTSIDFKISHLTDFRRVIAGPGGLLLYLADNAGEQFFDRPLVLFLRRLGWQVLYVVKGGPIQNDLTLKDLENSGLKADLEPVVDTGACTVGLDLHEASPEFRNLYGAARIILAKGMGHFETMSHLKDPRIWFLLQAKCDPVARSLGVDRNIFVFLQNSAISLETLSKTE